MDETIWELLVIIGRKRCYFPVFETGDGNLQLKLPRLSLPLLLI